MLLKSTTLCFVALALFGCLCDAQLYKQGSQRPYDQQKPSDPQQSKHTFDKPFTWKYPKDPVEPPKPVIAFEQRYPIAATTVAVECREKDARVEVQKDLFGIGQLINPSDLLLGDCFAVAEDPTAQVLIFESELHQCGSISLMAENSVIYSFVLNYNPSSLGSTSVVRTNKAVIIVECHYARRTNVSSLAIDPDWISYSSTKVAAEFLYFSLTLMTDDWQNERPSPQYFLGNVINIEAMVKQYFHVPLRVFISRCVATLDGDEGSSPTYAFIEEGCMIDAFLTGSSSKFRPRTDESILQFQLEAFRFQNADSGLMYITCTLIATSTNHPFDNDHRACYYENGWKEASGSSHDHVCNSCESVARSGVGASVGTSWNPGSGVTQKPRKSRDASTKDFVLWKGMVKLGPFSIGEKPTA